MKIIYSPRFIKRYSDLENFIKVKAGDKENIFRENPFDPRLRTHKLSGHLDGLWSFSIDYDYRIVFEFASKERVIFHTIGRHSIYM